MLIPRTSHSISCFLMLALLFVTCSQIDVWSQTQGQIAAPGQANRLKQEETMAEVTRLENLAGELYEQGKYEAAIKLLERALAISQESFGTDNPDFATLLSHLASIYEDKGDFARAEENGLRSLAIREKTLGANHPDVAESLNQLGLLNYNKGDFILAEQRAKRALSIREKVLSSTDPLVAQSLNSLAVIYMETGNLSSAEELSKRALGIYEKALGADHYLVALTLNNLGTLYGDKGAYGLAQQAFQKALAIIHSQKTLSPDHPQVTAMLNSMAVMYQKQGAYPQAEEIFLRALDATGKRLGTNHPKYAFVLSNVASFYQETGNYVRAEELYQSALEIQQRAFGTMMHPDISLTLNNLALLYRAKGDHVRAQQKLLKALEIIEKTLGVNHPRYGQSLLNLALLYQENGDSSLAEQVFENALGFYVKLYGNNHPDVATILNNIGMLYFDKADYNKAERAFSNSLDISMKVLGADHPNIALILNNLAVLYEKKADYLHAEQFHLRALKIRENALGMNHPILTQSLNNITGLYLVRGDIKQAILTQTRSNDIDEHNLALMLTVGSEIQKLLYMNTLAGRTAGTVSLHLHSAPNSLDAARLALTTILRRKGRALDAITDQVGALRRRLNSQDIALLDELSAVNSQLAALTLRGAGQRVNPTQFRDAIARLEEEKERLEARISSRSTEFRSLSLPLTLERVRQVIPENAALVEIVTYRPYDVSAKLLGQNWGEMHYAVYVLRREGEETFVDLGEAAPIDQAVLRFRAALADPKSTDVKLLARALDELVMRPVRKLLGKTRTVLLSPDGQLNLIPFAALVDEQGRYLVENYSFTYLTSGRDLLRLDAQAQSRQPPVVLANPTFNFGVTTDDRNIVGLDVAKGRRSIDFKTLRIISPLPGTAQEAAAIKSIVPSAQVLTERAATEAALKHVAGPRFLHIATHGFFLQDQPAQIADPSRRISMPDAPQAAQGENPLLRSGLVLAGVSKGQSGAGEDGVLTALEVAGLDLWGTKLVVLSACDTAVGDVSNGEGVYGLRRALVLAGAESQLMSLWQVSDRATRDLMIDYYRRLERGEGRTEALRAAQLQMLDSNKPDGQAAERRIGAGSTNGANYEHPYYWASFIPIGDWRPMNKPTQPLGEPSPQTSARILQPAINPTSIASEPTVEALTAMGNVSYDKGDFAAAASFYQRSLALRPDNVEVRADLGNTYFYQASPDYSAAITEYRKALKIAPKDERVWYNLAVAALRKKSELTARDAINQLAEINPSNPELKALRAALASIFSEVNHRDMHNPAIRVVTMHR